jgi:hypothetical protein
MRKDFLPLHEAAGRIAAAMLPIVQQHQEPTCPSALRTYYRDSLKWMVRLLETFLKPYASKAALETAQAHALEDLRRLRWKDQKRKMKDSKRLIFHWEHVVQVTDIVDSILALKKPTVGAIAEELKKAKVAWILKSENKKLLHKNRPNDNYQTAGITLLEPLAD